jgi:hypothetical protein
VKSTEAKVYRIITGIQPSPGTSSLVQHSPGPFQQHYGQGMARVRSFLCKRRPDYAPACAFALLRFPDGRRPHGRLVYLRADILEPQSIVDVLRCAYLMQYWMGANNLRPVAVDHASKSTAAGLPCPCTANEFMLPEGAHITVNVSTHSINLFVSVSALRHSLVLGPKRLPSLNHHTRRERHCIIFVSRMVMCFLNRT